MVRELDRAAPMEDLQNHVGDAFRDGNFTAEEIQILIPAVRAKISELIRLPGPQTALTTN